MDKYTAYVRANKRKLIVEREISIKRAIDFLDETKNGLVIGPDGTEYTVKEELEYVKSIGSKPRVKSDNLDSGGRSVHEDSSGELFESFRDYAESSSERDN